jgi:hypothetical protein
VRKQDTNAQTARLLTLEISVFLATLFVTFSIHHPCPAIIVGHV